MSRQVYYCCVPLAGFIVEAESAGEAALRAAAESRVVSSDCWTVVPAAPISIKVKETEVNGEHAYKLS